MSAAAGFQRHLQVLTPHNRWPRYKSACASVLLLFMVLSPLFAQSPSPAELETAQFGKTIRSIEYSSDIPLNRSHYDPFLGVKPGDILTRTGVKNSIQFLYDCARFSSIRVEALSIDDGVRLIFQVRHNYYFNKFSLDGDVDLKGRSLWEWVALPSGQRFTPEMLERSRQAVLKFIVERGFYDAQVQARSTPDEKSRQVNTVFQVNPGQLATIRSIEVRGVPPQNARELEGQFGFRKGQKYNRSRLPSRLDALRKRFLKNGFLDATAQVLESFDPSTKTVALELSISNYGKIKVTVEGFKIDKNKLRGLLPVLAGEGVKREILDEGIENLREHLVNQGYSEAKVQISETVDRNGVRQFRYRIIPGRKYTVSYVRFSGNYALTAEEMLSSIEIQSKGFFQGKAYSAARLESDVESLKTLYHSRGYLNIKVTPTLEPIESGRKLGITYLCEEGEQSRTRSVTISGNASISNEELMSRIALAPGNPYSPSLAERDRQALLAVYNDLGYMWAQVIVKAGVPDDTDSYPLEFHVQEGHQAFVARVLVLGNEKTRSSVVQKRIRLKENEPFSLGKMLQTQQRLYGLGVFDQVRVGQQSVESTAPYQDVVVRLQESKRFTMRYGLGYQERERLRGTLEFTHDNIFGFAQRAQIRFRGSSIEQQAIFSLQQPQFRPVPVDSNFTFSFLNKKDVSFDSRRFNVSYQYSHPFGNHSWGMLRYNFRKVQILNSQISESDLERQDSPGKYSTFSVAFINDTRDNYLDPNKGFFSSTDFGITPRFLSSDGFLSFFTQNSYYRRLPWSLSLAGAVRVGAAYSLEKDPYLPVSERFFAGGSSSLRGFDTDYAGPLDPDSNKPLGGNALFVGSIEVRVPLFSFVHIAGLYDTGNVFRTISEVNFHDFSHTLGGGLRIKTPFGPLRADYGWNMNLSQDLMRRGLKRGHFFITVGPPF